MLGKIKNVDGILVSGLQKKRSFRAGISKLFGRVDTLLKIISYISFEQSMI